MKISNGHRIKAVVFRIMVVNGNVPDHDSYILDHGSYILDHGGCVPVRGGYN